MTFSDEQFTAGVHHKADYCITAVSQNASTVKKLFTINKGVCDLLRFFWWHKLREIERFPVGFD